MNSNSILPALVGFVLILTFSGCDSSSISSNDLNKDGTVATTKNKAQKPGNFKKGPTKGLTAKNRFNIDITAQGSLKPGNSVSLSTKVQSYLPSCDADIKLLLPEITAIENGFNLIAKTPLATQMSRKVSLGKGRL